jgi:hypothetical protein
LDKPEEFKIIKLTTKKSMDSILSNPLFMEGKKFVRDKKWEEAIEVFSVLLEEQ